MSDAHKGYIAAVMSANAAKRLRKLAKHPKVYCHHVTMAYMPDDATYRKYSHLIGKKIPFMIRSIVHNRRGQAAVVWGIPSENVNPHITVSCAEGTNPVYSNELLKQNPIRTRLHRQSGFATVQFIPL